MKAYNVADDKHEQFLFLSFRVPSHPRKVHRFFFYSLGDFTKFNSCHSSYISVERSRVVKQGLLTQGEVGAATTVRGGGEGTVVFEEEGSSSSG